MIDPSYMNDALAWTVVWGALGLTARQILARSDQRRQQRQHGQRNGAR